MRQATVLEPSQSNLKANVFPHSSWLGSQSSGSNRCGPSYSWPWWTDSSQLGRRMWTQSMCRIPQQLCISTIRAPKQYSEYDTLYGMLNLVTGASLVLNLKGAERKETQGGWVERRNTYKLTCMKKCLLSIITGVTGFCINNNLSLE